MSSAILYLAIVGIWAGVLVPRWLRPGPPQRHWTGPEQEAPAGGEADPTALDETAAPAGPEPTQQATEATEPGAALVGAGPAARREPPSRRTESRTPARPSRTDAERRLADRQYAWTRAAGRRVRVQGRSPAAVQGRPARAQTTATAEMGTDGPAWTTEEAAARRTNVLRARRWMFVTLAGLTLGAFVIALTRLAAVWVVVPPVVMLAFFLMLLREAARTDAVRAQRRARFVASPAPARDDLRFEREKMRPERPGQEDEKTAAATAGTGRGAADVAYPGLAAEAGFDAEVIDISARVADEPYDQYTDAAERAVGD